MEDMKVKVPRVTLLEKLRENRKKHLAVYEESVEEYVEKALKALRQRGTQFKLFQKAGSMDLPKLHFGLSIPVKYTNEYDTVIGMLEMSGESVVELTTADYRRFVEDNWDWKRTFEATNTFYSKTLRGE